MCRRPKCCLHLSLSIHSRGRLDPLGILTKLMKLQLNRKLLHWRLDHIGIGFLKRFGIGTFVRPQAQPGVGRSTSNSKPGLVAPGSSFTQHFSWEMTWSDRRIQKTDHQRPPKISNPCKQIIHFLENHGCKFCSPWTSLGRQWEWRVWASDQLHRAPAASSTALSLAASSDVSWIQYDSMRAKN